MRLDGPTTNTTGELQFPPLAGSVARPAEPSYWTRRLPADVAQVRAMHLAEATLGGSLFMTDRPRHTS
jgi:hypothetical protein